MHAVAADVADRDEQLAVGQCSNVVEIAADARARREMHAERDARHQRQLAERTLLHPPRLGQVLGGGAIGLGIVEPQHLGGVGVLVVRRLALTGESGRAALDLLFGEHRPGGLGAARQDFRHADHRLRGELAIDQIDIRHQLPGVGVQPAATLAREQAQARLMGQQGGDVVAPALDLQPSR